MTDATRVQRTYGYPASYVVSGAVQALAIPFVFLARRENAPSGPIDDGTEPVPAPVAGD